MSYEDDMHDPGLEGQLMQIRQDKGFVMRLYALEPGEMSADKVSDASTGKDVRVEAPAVGAWLRYLLLARSILRDLSEQASGL